MMESFGRIMMQETSRRGGVAVQLLQTLSIMILNIRSDTLLYYIFSNNHINQLIALPYDFRDEELLAHYVSFLKTLSSKLNDRTVQFFFASTSASTTPESSPPGPDEKSRSSAAAGGRTASQCRSRHSNFPLFTKAIGLFDHSESMVRAAVRTLTLNVYSINDELVQEWLASSAACKTYSSLLAEYTLLNFRELIDLVDVVGDGSARPQRKGAGSLHDALAEIGDLLYYYNDLLSLRQCKVGMPIARIFWGKVVRPLIIDVIRCGEREEDIHRAPLICALYFASRIFDIIRHTVFLSAFAAELLLPADDGSAYTAAMVGEDDDAIGLDARGSDESEDDDQTQGRSPDDCGGTGGEQGSESQVLKTLIGLLRSEDVQIASGALGLLVEVLRSPHVNDEILHAAGLLPMRRLQKLKLIQGLSSSLDDADDSVRLALEMNGGNDDEETPPVTPATADEGERGGAGAPEAAGVSTGPNTAAVPVTPAIAVPVATVPAVPRKGSVVAEAAAHPIRRMLIEGCIGVFDSHRFFMRRSLVCAAWIIAQSLTLPRRTASWDMSAVTASKLGGDGAAPDDESPRSAGRAKLLPEWEERIETFTGLAHAALLEDSEAIWGDGVVGLIVSEWSSIRRALEALPKSDEGGEGVLSPCVYLNAGNDGQSASLVHGVRRSVQRTVAMKMLQSLLCGRTPAPRAPLSAGAVPFSASVTVGDEIEMEDSIALPCRVAFERGREMVVYIVVHGSTPALPASLLLLLEPAPRRLGWGTVRAVAPIMSAQPRLDARHPEWLHVYVRAPLSSLETLDKNQRVGGRRLIDGQWTLAFSNEAASETAIEMIRLYHVRLQDFIREAIRPLLE